MVDRMVTYFAQNYANLNVWENGFAPLSACGEGPGVRYIITDCPATWRNVVLHGAAQFSTGGPGFSPPYRAPAGRGSWQPQAD